MRFLLVVFIAISSFCKAQFLLEDSDDANEMMEYGVSNIIFNFNQLEYYKLKCEKPQYAQFLSERNTFAEELRKYMRTTLDSGSYAVNGSFYLIFEINQNGEVAHFQMKPAVQNSEMLYKDIQFAVEKMKSKWQPAMCDNQPINSRIRLKINFSSESFDK